MTKASDKKFSTIIGFILILGFCIGAIIWRIIAQADLKKNGVIVQARIIGVNTGGKGSGGFQCLFEYKGKKMEQNSPSSVQRGKFELIGKTFPAMYAPKTNTLEILITDVDFRKFGLPFPDSLHWIWKYDLEIRE